MPVPSGPVPPSFPVPLHRPEARTPLTPYSRFNQNDLSLIQPQSQESHALNPTVKMKRDKHLLNIQDCDINNMLKCHVPF